MADPEDQQCIWCGGETNVRDVLVVGRGTVWYCPDCDDEFETEDVTRNEAQARIDHILSSVPEPRHDDTA